MGGQVLIAKQSCLLCSLVEGMLLDEYMAKSLDSKAPQQHVQTVLQTLKKMLQVCQLPSQPHGYCYVSVTSVLDGGMPALRIQRYDAVTKHCFQTVCK